MHPFHDGDGGDSGDDERIERALADADRVVLPNARRVFVNRTLRFDQIRLVGFDMDYTLLPYVKQQMERLSFELTIDKLIRGFGYPDSIAGLPYDHQFVVRGLVVDKRHGNILKLDQHRHVGRAFHGRTPLSKEERRALYRKEKPNLSGPDYHRIDTLFALPEAALYAEVVELLEDSAGPGGVDYRKVFEDIRAAIDLAHRDDSLKSVIKANLEQYVEIDPELPMALHKLRSAGKKLFLLTNSYWDYTQSAMSFLLDGRSPEYPTWRSYFDFVVVGAQKPGFFTEPRPFLPIDPDTGEVSSTAATRLDRQGVYQGGCLDDLERFIEAAGDEILYVGDHIYGDIILSKKKTLWRTALVLTELEDELGRVHELQRAQADLVELDERRGDLDFEITQARLRVAAIEQALDDKPDRTPTETDELLRRRQRLRHAIDDLRARLREVLARREALETEVESALNPYWGSVFKEGADNSLFGDQVEEFACVYTSRASNFVFYSPQQYFRAPRHWLPHEKL